MKRLSFRKLFLGLLVITCLVIVVWIGYVSKGNTSMVDVRKFIDSDDTSEHCYIPIIYDCKYFVGQVVLRAQMSGLNIRPCLIFFDWNRWHTIAWFKDNDGKIYYIECDNDRTSGKQPEGGYWDISKFPQIRF